MKGIAFDRQPTLTGALLQLRPLRANGWDALFAVASDPLLWAQHPDSDRYQESVFRQFFADAMSSGGALVAIERATGEIVGSSRFHGFDAEQSVIEVGWSFLARRCWGGTYNGEMKRLMLRHALHDSSAKLAGLSVQRVSRPPSPGCRQALQRARSSA